MHDIVPLLKGTNYYLSKFVEDDMALLPPATFKVHRFTLE